MLDELLKRIKNELTKLAPILDLHTFVCFAVVVVMCFAN
jgi:hypothetical protein